MLRKGRVIFSFVDLEGNDVGGFSEGERKFWGWECYDYHECSPGDGCSSICATCDYYVFGVAIVRGKERVDAFGGC